MSQQSNPATLREALTAIICDLRRREKRNLNSAHASLRGFAEAAGYAADKLEKVAALAASGTEAAPRDVSERTLPGTCNYPFVAAGSKELGIELMITDRCELLHGHAGRHKNGNASWGQPAPAAASPEGEGRETPEEYKFNCEWKLVPSNRPVDGIDPDDVTKEFVYELPGETRVNGNVGAWYQSAVYWKHRALRQSAAPSGVDLREAWFEYLRSLAPESKTGAVKETK